MITSSIDEEGEEGSEILVLGDSSADIYTFVSPKYHQPRFGSPVGQYA